jgi:ketosteroid isomerase-like protein
MSRPLIALAVLAVACLSTLSVGAQAPEHLRMKGVSEQQQMVEVLLRLERETTDAIRDKDAKALERILDNVFVYRTPEAEIGRADFLKNITSLPGRILSVEGTGLRVSVYGETAVVTGVQKAVLRTEDGMEHPSTTAFTDIFIKRRRQWHLVLAYGVELPTASARPQ